jgi:subtilase family serine protease/flagellar hook assembly protein FlgD
MGVPRGRTGPALRRRGAARPRRSEVRGRRAFGSALALVLPLLLSSTLPLHAQSADELRQAAARLHALAASIEPLPDSPLNRDVGHVAVIEHDGSTYDVRVDGALNYEARTRVGLRFYETHADEYDFLVVFTNFPFETGAATAFHLFGRNDVEGIGKPVGSAGPSPFGSRSRLKGWIDMADVSRYRERPFSLEPGDPGFLDTLGTLAHEMGHQWLAEVRYKVGDTVFDDLLGADDVHWSYLLDSDASFLYGADWRDGGDGTFRAAAVKERYSDLDLYLMGLLPKDEVPPLTLLRSPGVDRRRINREGEVVPVAATSTILVDQIVDAMGPRRPDHLHSQKEFRLGFVFLTRPGTEPSAEDLEAVERVRRAFGARFFALTHGVGWADTTLGPSDRTPRAAAPDVPRALGWLASRQDLDGSWADGPQTRVRDTAAAVVALLRTRTALPAAQRGMAWLVATRPESLDFHARVTVALDPALLSTAERASRAAALLAVQNADGGFGAGPDFASGPLDTALALRALAALGHPADARVARAVQALAALANPDGGWPGVAGGDTSTVATAEVLLALLDWSEVPGSAALRAQGLAALLARRNPDGGLGSSPSTAYASALALEVLLRSGAGADLVDPLTAWLHQAQLADGSWGASPWQTALVVGALGRALGANLVVPVLDLFPNPAREGEVVRVAAVVRNAGRVAAPASVARLHDGDPASSPAVGEAAVPPLGPGEESEVFFDYPTADRAGTRTLHVVADATLEVAESREDDNTASRSLGVEGPLADLEVLPADILVSPSVPEAGETATLSVTVRNRGERASPACTVALSLTDAAGRTPVPTLIDLGPLGPGESGVASTSWTPEAEGVFLAAARADATFAVPESDETNGTAAREVRVVSRAPDGAELSLLAPRLLPAVLEELPQALEVRVLVQNAGRSAATTSVAVYDPVEGPDPVGSAPVDLDARSSVELAVPVTISRPGPRWLRLVVDPDEAIPEEDEGDNVADVRLGDARTHDLEVVAASLSKEDVVVGETVTVTVEVRNRGTLDVADVPVQLGWEGSGSVSELARAVLALPAGEAVLATLSWTPLEAADDLPLVARVDPFDLLRERREDNNALPLRLRVRPSGLPNLVVSGGDVAVAPDPPVEGHPATVSAVVRNTGTSASGAFAVGIFLGDPDAGGALLGEVEVADVEAGGERAVSLGWNVVGLRGTVGVFVVADVRQEVAESVETDNRALRPFSIVGLPDLVLTAADVALDPGYPRAGESVTVRATVRNLGGQEAGATSLVVTEHAGGDETPVGTAAVPALAAGGSAEVSLAWVPDAPPGPRSLSLVLDPEGAVVEQDEGNNAARRSFVVQDADLYLTEPFFSPDGDGVKDESTLAWRAGGQVAVAVSDRTGRLVRTLLAAGPAEGSAVWDGRDERGLLVPDGAYTFTLAGAGGRVLNRLAAVVDTNRSPLHDAGPGRTLVRNLTCALPDSADDLAWMPAEDAALVVVRSSAEGFEPGLLRVGLDGSHEYLHRDPFYANAWFASDAAVSSDGREVLMRSSEGLVRVDLATGARSPLAGDPYNARWSPDSRFVSMLDRVVTRDGEPVADLGALTGAWGEWAWAPASDRLALGNVVASRDGGSVTTVPLPVEQVDEPMPQWTTWLPDGRILTGLWQCGMHDRAPPAGPAAADWIDDCEAWYRIDPEAGTAEALSWRASARPDWSPVGDRVLTDGLLREADGSPLWPLLPQGSRVSPRSSAAWFRRWAGETDRPGRVCGDKSYDTFAVTSLANLTADMRVTRLPANNGLLVRGTVADANLDRFQLDYARQGGETWHPIGPASDVPVVDDELTPWVPPGPGTYVLRLRAHDRAGNTITRTRVVSWDRVPALANFTQTDYFLSPNGDGAKDDVRFGFLVLEPTTLHVRVVGPEAVEGGPPPVERRDERVVLSALGPASYTWDGRDAQARVVPDGRYTVYLNDLPFRVQVDSTPPDIAFRLDNPHVKEGAMLSGPACRAFGSVNQAVELGSVAADRSWHVVDPHLRAWTFWASSGPPVTGSDEVFDVERDSEGLPVVGPGGELRMRRVGGRPADRVDEERDALWLAQRPGFRFEAEDHAGNRSEIAVPSLPERIFPLGAAYHCTPLLSPPVEGEGDPPSPQALVHPLAPAEVVLVAGATLNREYHEQGVRFAFQPREGGAWTEAALPEQEGGGEWDLPVERFEDLGIDPIRTYRGRFLGDGRSGEVASESFLFRPCREWLSASVEFPDPPSSPLLVVRTETSEPVVSAWATVGRTRVDLVPVADGVFVAPALPTCDPPRYSVHVRTASGRELPDDPMRATSCLRVEQNWPTPPSCGSQVRLRQEFPYCGGTPDEVHLDVGGVAATGSRVDIEVAGRGEEPLASFLVDEAAFERRIVASVAGEPEGVLLLRARVFDPGAAPDEPAAEASLSAVIDKTPPFAEVLLPPEGGLACLAPAAGAEVLTLRARAADVSPRLEIESAAVRMADGPWSSLRRLCAEPPCDPFVTRGVPTELEWDAAGVQGGEVESRLSFCDRAGNRAVVHHGLTITRPGKPRVVSVSRSPFSPDGDGRADEVEVVFRLAEAAVLSARVRRGSSEGPVVRSLFSGRFELAGDVAVAWDGRRDDGGVEEDGAYVIVLSTENGCGVPGEASAAVDVDRTPPDVRIASPAADQRVRATADVRGLVSDDHLDAWRLDVACGGGDFTPVASGRQHVSPEGRLAAWDTSLSPPGPCTLRLAAEDRALNRAEVEVPVEVESGGLVRQLAATPEVFSPNGDGRRETTLIRHGLHERARTSLRIRRPDGSVVLTLVEAEVRDAGAHEVGWDGRDGAGVLVPDGEYVAWLRAEAPDQPGVYEEEVAGIVVDATAPAVVVSLPTPGGFVSADTRVRGSVGDAHLVEWTLEVTPDGGSAVELARDSRPIGDQPLGSLARFEEGRHALTLVATDEAENRTEVAFAFWIDSSPPEVELASPADGSILARGEAPVPVGGRVEDANPGGWTLRFGAGAEPAAWGTIATGVSAGPALALGSWDVRFLPDGTYTLALAATDQASLSAEARVAVTLDGTPPAVAITTPSAGAWVSGPGPIEGTASDASLRSWLVEAAPGPPATAFRWEPVLSGEEEVDDDAFGIWSPLPPDGTYTLRLTATDEVGLSSSVRLGVTVDTTPPAAPTGLAASVERASDTHGLVRLTWNASPEADLAGYVVSRDDVAQHDATHASPDWDDGERLEGTYGYSVVAVDQAGNRSEAARLRVRVDVTPPAVSFSSPGEGAAVSGAVEVRGTAYSADDFAEYRLFAGAGEAPAAWTLLQRSTVPVAASRLGEWLALSDGPYRLALEAEDDGGNRARVTRGVVVDTVPPAAPVLTAVAGEAAPADWLRPEWEPSASPDVAGTLVYRNGRLANAASLVIGDPTAYLVPGRAYHDAGLPDGRHCYEVVAVDEAGNLSVPSNEICRALDNRPPRAEIVRPLAGGRFGDVVGVVAATPDTDVAEVRFELRTDADPAWRLFGAVAGVDGQPAPPWETLLDPAAHALEPGPVELRAVATDHAGHADPDPAVLALVYGDTTPPPAPADLAARVDGADVSLEWAASDAPDLASYRVYRDGERVAEGILLPRLTDAGRPPARYEYVVTAVDADGNEGAPSLPAEAVVYALRLEEPSWPVTPATAATVRGDGARDDTTVRVTRDGQAVASVPASAGGFVVEAVPLAPGGNVLAARGEDAAGNRSLVSNEIVLVANDPPGAVSDLTATVDGHSVALEWGAVGDPDLHGYLLRRDGRRLTRTVPQEEATVFEASPDPQSATRAFDGDPGTAWPAAPAAGEWTVGFPAPVLVERVRIRFAEEPGVAAAYTLLARWEGRYVPVARALDNAQPVVEHRLPAPFATDSLRVVLATPGRLAEVTVERLDAVPAGTTTAVDPGVPDGPRRYEVAAVDRYGAEGAAGVVDVGVGDVHPPAPPTGLVAVPEGRDVQLRWDPGPEPDLAGYVIVRDGVRVASTADASHLDRGLAYGTYVYAVLAVDLAGLESDESEPASATIAPSGPPAAPVILEPTDAAHPVSLFATRVDVGGRADAGSTVELEVNGVVHGTAEVRPGLAFAGRVALPQVLVLVLSPDGRLAAWKDYWGRIVVREIPGGPERVFEHGATSTVGPLVFSPDGGRLAFGRYVSGPGHDVAVLDLADGTVRRLAGGDPVAIAWSPDAARLAVARRDGATDVLETVDVGSGSVAELLRSSAGARWLRWSPRGSRLALLQQWSGGAAELRVIETATGQSTLLDARPWPDAPPDWSSDGSRLAWTTATTDPPSVRLHDVSEGSPAGEIREGGLAVRDARFSPDGEWLSYVRDPGSPESLRSVVVRHLRSAAATVVGGGPRESSLWPVDHEWRQGRLSLRDGFALEAWAPEAERFLLPGVPLSPGENLLVARATDPVTRLTGVDSEAVLVTVDAHAFPDLAVAPGGILSIPPVPLAGRASRLRLRVDNRGAAGVAAAELEVRVTGPAGDVLDTTVAAPPIDAGSTAWLDVGWTPPLPGRYTVRVAADPADRVAEADEGNNVAERSLVVVEGEGVGALVRSDRPVYGTASPAAVTVSLANSGEPFEGTARTTVEEPGGGEVAVLDERAVSLEYGAAAEIALGWNTGATRAGRYAFRVRVRPAGDASPVAAAESPFDIEPALAVLARVRPEPVAVAEGGPVSFALSVHNQGANAPLDGATARLRVQPEGAPGPATFETVRALPPVPPAGAWEAVDQWAAARPPGRYAVLFEVERAGLVLAASAAVLSVEPAAPAIHGTVEVEPREVLAGQEAVARVTIENLGAAGVSGHPLLVEVVSGPEATVHLTVPASVDLGPGASATLALPVGTGSVPPARHVVRLRAGAPPVTLDRASLVVHGVIAPPSPHAPADGSRVDTSFPALVVNNASSPEGAPLSYEFQLFGDLSLTQSLPGGTGVPQAPSRTAWTVGAGLAEEASYWWRARATDGFSTSAWSAVSSFTVDAVDLPPTAPAPDTPVPGSPVASRQPVLTVRNAVDPEGQPLAYEFRLAGDEGMSDVVGGEAGVAEGPGFTSWTPPVTLEEGGVYFWSARAKTPGDAPESWSPWSVPVWFRVDTANGPPTAPRPLRPTGGEEVATATPELVVENATDPEDDPLVYRFEIDTSPGLDSPARQASPELPEGPGETAWTPPVALAENAVHYWRAHASDGVDETPSALAAFRVNAVNEAPSAPVPLDPVDGRTVGTATPTLLVRNATDPDGDPLVYELEVRDKTGAVVAAAADVPSGPAETAWTVSAPLAENEAFTWSARASDGELAGPWSPPAAFRVDAVVEPPTAPVPFLPPDGATLDLRRPDLVVLNATSPDGLALAYTFELEAVADDGSATPVERGDDVPETEGTTAFAPSADLADGGYQWRARASDPRSDGPWSATSRFSVLVDPPPAAPTGLRALAGDARVRLDWDESPEPDVTGYRVHRSTFAGGPYAPVGLVAVPAFDDLGLANGVTYYYVVTALDARGESPHSNEAAARPDAPHALVAEVRYDPAVIRAECLLPARHGHHRAAALPPGRGVGGEDAGDEADAACRRPKGCPEWLHATIELPPGHDPATIDLASIRLLGSVPAAGGYAEIVDEDGDGLPERRVRFALDAVAEHLSVGPNAATIVARAGGAEVRGTGAIEVRPLATQLRVTPRTLNRRAPGQDVLAQVTFAEGVRGGDVDLGSVRLNGVVPVHRLVAAHGRTVHLKFDRAAVAGVLPLGPRVEVRVTGTLRGLAFVGIDHIRVIE